MTGSYDPMLVALSIALAVFASWVTLALAARVTHARGRIRTGWLAGGAAAMGTGLWSVHLVGMQAFRLSVPMGYDARLWLPALGLAGMHPVGMAAARITVAGTGMAGPADSLLVTNGLAAAGVLGAAGVLALALLGALVERRLRFRSVETEALRRSEDRFRSLVLASAQIIWSADAHGELVADQPDWGAFTGTAPQEYRGWGWMDGVHPDDRARVHAAWKKALAGGRTGEAEFRVRRWDGEWRHVAWRAVPVLEPGGRVREWVGAVNDVTEARRDEEERDFLAEASRVMASSLDYETTLANVARLAVPQLADWCAVDVVGDHGAVRRVSVAHPDPARVRMVKELEERYPADADAAFGLPQVLRTGQPELVPEIPEQLLAGAAKDDEHLRLIRALGLRSYVIVPMRARDVVVGAITLVAAESGRRYGPVDLALAEDLARRAAVAIDNARLFRETEEARVQLEQQAGELEEAQAEMEMAHDELQSANDELVRRTADAERARAEAEEANQAKSAFLATMSHELRTPLNAIAGYAQLMDMGIHGPVTPKQRENLEKIRRNQAHLLELINDVLNFAKIEAGQVRYEIAEVPVDATLSAVEPLVEPQLRAKGLHYAYRRGDPSVAACADRERVEQIVLNLLTNAVKFTGPGGRVSLEWEADDARVAVQVRDTGRGIPRDRQHAVFEPFVQVDPALTRSSEGTGLGLSISRDLARAMGGDLTLCSEVGVGSTFTLTLPRGTPGCAQAKAASHARVSAAGTRGAADPPTEETGTEEMSGRIGDAGGVDVAAVDGGAARDRSGGERA
ncbi:MAG: ATP-binding region ATPase domain protein [Gemmatimonadetes bacterium]|nr:ATP-binding region ATPase domain protein [Gemmatimonadota bacterium]